MASDNVTHPERGSESVPDQSGDHDQSEHRVSRRGALRAVASAGYVGGVANYLGVGDFLAADDKEVSVVTALVRTDPTNPWSIERRTKTVPGQWYQAVTKAFELNELLARSRITGYLGSAVVPGSYDEGGARLTVQLTSDMSVGEVKSNLDTVLGGISLDAETLESLEEMIEFEQVGEIGGFADRSPPEPRFLDHVTDRIPGGIACETADSLATLGPALYHPSERRQFFVTAEHAFRNPDALGGDQLELPLEHGGAIPLGSIASAYVREDVVSVTPTEGYTPESAIAGPERVSIRGQFTRFGLADLVARNQPLEKVGAMTGHTTGPIQGIDAVNCLTGNGCLPGQIRWGDETDLTDGDSGSVCYHPDPEAPDDGVLVAGFNNARTWWPGQSYIWGVAAYRLTDRYGYHF